MRIFLKKHAWNLFWIALFFVFILSTSAKAVLIRGMMELGLLAANVENSLNETLKVPSVRFLDVKKREIVAIKDLQGRVVFINFWATWCPPCLAEMSSIHKLYQKFKTNDAIVFLMVEVDGNVEGALKLYDKKGFDLPLFLPQSDIPTQLLSGSIPTTIVLNKQGKIVLRHEGGANYHRKKIIEFLETKIKE